MKQINSLAHQISFYFKHPGEHPQELAIVLLALLISLAFLSLLIGLLFPKKPSAPVTDSEFNPETIVAHSKKTWPALVGLGLAGIVLLGLLLTSLVYSSSAGFCDNCHRMKPYYKSFKKSAHKKIDCIACHQKPGVTGFLITRAEGLRNYSLTNIYNARFRPVTAAVIDNRSCLRCHAKITHGVATKKDIKVRHKDFIDSLACADCHRRTGHRTVAKPLSGVEIMGRCMLCHAKKRALAKCAVCHTKNTNSRIEYPDLYIFVEPNTGCDNCHTAKNCTRCHQELLQQ